MIYGFHCLPAFWVSVYFFTVRVIKCQDYPPKCRRSSFKYARAGVSDTPYGGKSLKPGRFDIQWNPHVKVCKNPLENETIGWIFPAS